jgi:hypothetical protein
MTKTTMTNRSTNQLASVWYSPKGGPMSKTSATRSVCATLLVAALGLLLATPAQAGLVLDLTTVEGNLNANSVTVQPGMLAGTSTSFTVYLYAVVSGGTSLTNNALEAVTANIVGVSNGTNTTGGYVFSTGGTSGISTVSTDLNAWSLLAQNGSPNDGTLTGTASGLGGAQLGTNSWGSNTNGLNYIGVSKGTKATTAMQEGTDGFAPSTNTWAYLVATVTLTVNANDLVGSGTVDYQAQLSAAPGTLPSAIYFANGTGTVAQKLYAAGSGAAAASTANSASFVVNYTAPASNATLALANLTTSGTIFAGGSFNAIGTLTASGSDATNAKLTLTGTSGNLNILSGSAGTGTLTASTGSLTLSSTVNSTGTAGSYVLTYTGTSDNNVATVTNTLNLTVLEHASPTGTATVSIGSVLGGAPNVTATMTLGNASSDGNMTRGSLQVTGTTAGLSGAPIGTLLAAGSSTTLTAVINAASKSTAPGSFTVNVSDNQAYNGYRDDRLGVGQQFNLLRDRPDRGGERGPGPHRAVLAGGRQPPRDRDRRHGGQDPVFRHSGHGHDRGDAVASADGCGIDPRRPPAGQRRGGPDRDAGWHVCAADEL